MIARGSNHHGYPVGTRVIANWQGRGAWFLGEVAAVSLDRVFIRYIDGDEEWVTLDRVMEPKLVVGLRVVARWQRCPAWYPGVIAAMEGGRVGIQYFDGDQEWTEPDLVRVDDIREGDWLVVDLEGTRRYTPAKIVERQRDGFLVELLDGTRAQTTIRNVGLDLDARETGYSSFARRPEDEEPDPWGFEP